MAVNQSEIDAVERSDPTGHDLKDMFKQVLPATQARLRVKWACTSPSPQIRGTHRSKGWNKA